MNSGKLISAEDFQARLKKIKLLLLDVDGILTDARTFYIDGTGFVRVFNMYEIGRAHV